MPPIQENSYRGVGSRGCIAVSENFLFDSEKTCIEFHPLLPREGCLCTEQRICRKRGNLFASSINSLIP
jgi:hypothetical protein